MPINCANCGSTMKPLFYMHSLFCPNDCDLKIKDGWIKADTGNYLYKILPPGVPYPESAKRYLLLQYKGEESSAKQVAMSNISSGTKFCLSGVLLDKQVRDLRADPSSDTHRYWVLITKEW